MQTKLLHDDGLRTFVVVFDTGEEVAEGLVEFARAHDVGSAHFTAIGALQEALLGFFDLEKKDYVEIPVETQVEVLAMTGNLARHEGKPKLHAHVVVGERDGMARGGHLLSATARPTLEVLLTETPARLDREIDEATNLPLLRL